MFAILSVLIGFTLEFSIAAPAIKYYASRYDHLDVESILNNRRMVNYYSSCLLSKGPCPPEGIEFKRILPEALHTNCARCSEKQKTVTLRTIKRLKKEYPKVWTQLMEIWDPDDVYIKKFEMTFGAKSEGVTPTSEVPVTLPNRFGFDEENSVDGNLSSATTSKEVKTTTNKALTSTITNRKSSLSSTSTVYSSPSTTSSSVTTTTSTTPKSIVASSTTPSQSTSSRTSTPTSTTPKSIVASSTSTIRTTLRIPGLVPLNTFFTNPPIPFRPLVNLDISANIGATVKAIKNVERIVADAAVQKIGLIKNIFWQPWKRRPKSS